MIWGLLLVQTVSTHSRPKAAGIPYRAGNLRPVVSTHSRPKAAGVWYSQQNTLSRRFQHTAARRRLGCVPASEPKGCCVSTHSRPKAAGLGLFAKSFDLVVSTHSRPKAAGRRITRLQTSLSGFNTQPPEGGWLVVNGKAIVDRLFQHTAARRRLVASTHAPRVLPNRFNTQPPEGGWNAIKERAANIHVSTHSRPKAAGCQVLATLCLWQGFNTQPPEGGWKAVSRNSNVLIWFQHTAARRRLVFRSLYL